MKKKNVFYGWYVVAAGCVVMSMTMGIISNCFGQFIKPVCADLGFTRQQMSMNQTILSVVSMVFALYLGRIIRKVNLHRFMCFSAALTPALYFCYSFCSTVTQFYAVSVVMSIIYCFVSMMVFTYIVGNWFAKSRGVAIGLMSMGSGLGAMLMNTVIARMILAWGWRTAYQATAVLMFVTVAPSVWFIVREKPESKGLMPYGYDETPAGGAVKAPAYDGYMLSEVIHTKLFWSVFATSVAMVFSIGAFYQTLSPHLSDSGYSVTFAAVMASICMGALAGGKVLLGRLFDRLGTRRAVTLACTCTFIGIMGMIFCRQAPALAAIVLGVGLGSAFGAICLPIICQNVFGMKDYASIYGKLTAATSLGGAFSPIVSGRVYDVTGSYVPIYAVAAVLVVISIFVLRAVLPKQDGAKSDKKA